MDISAAIDFSRPSCDEELKMERNITFTWERDRETITVNNMQRTKDVLKNTERKKNKRVERRKV